MSLFKFPVDHNFLHWETTPDYNGNKKKIARYRVKIYQCEGVCSGGICDHNRRKQCANKVSMIIRTAPVFKTREQADAWAEEITNLIYLLSNLSCDQGRKYYELRVG